jgi:acyl dehydratase
MKIDSRYVGTPLKMYETAVFPRDTMNFAAAIGDPNARYLDDERDGGLVAHPMHSVAVTWPILEHIDAYIDLESFPREILLTQVHYSEHLVLHRLMVPGDRLKIDGQIAAIVPHRAGTHMILRLSARDAGGQPVFTEYIGALMRGVTCTDPGCGAETIPALPGEAPGPPFSWASSMTIDPLLPYIFDGCTRIHFPIHTSRKFARQVGLPGIILQGTATLSLAVREIVNREAASDPRRIRSISCRFTGMVMPGETIVLQVNIGAPGGDVRFQVQNSQGRLAIGNGHIQLNPQEAP